MLKALKCIKIPLKCINKRLGSTVNTMVHDKTTMFERVQIARVYVVGVARLLAKSIQT